METAVEAKISIFALLLIGVVVGVFALLIWKKRQAGLYVGLGFSLLVVGGVLFLTFARHKTVVIEESRQQAARTELHMQAARAESLNPYTSVDPIWQVTVENEFEADVYPSVETAAQALGRKIAPKIAAFATQRKPAPKAYILTHGGGGETVSLPGNILKLAGKELSSIIQDPPGKIDSKYVVQKAGDLVATGITSKQESSSVDGMWEEINQSLHAMQNYPKTKLEAKALEAVRHELNTIIKLPDFTIERIAGDKAALDRIRSGEDAIVILVKIFNLSQDIAPWLPEQRQSDGTLEVGVRYGTGEFKEAVAFIEKPWVTNFSLFLSQEPGEHYFIAQSKKPCTGSSEARHEAMEDAAEQLAYRIVENAGRYREKFQLGKRSRWELRKIQALVRTELEGNQSERSQETSGPYVVRSNDVSYMNPIHSNQRGKYISDRFVQRFHRSYGDVWREALLVNASKENIDTLAGMYAQTLRQERESWLRIVLSALGMLGIVCIVYVFLNSATKGYYTAALRVAAVVLALAIIGIAVVLA